MDVAYESSWSSRPLICALAIIAYPLLRTIYNITLHPLASIPGPKLWACSPVPFLRSLIRGMLIPDVEKLHRQYGPIVRISPNEISFARADAWNDIFQSRPGRGCFARHQLWWRKQPGNPDSIISTPSFDDHQRMRNVLSQGFTTKALRLQEPIVQRYMALLVERLHEQAKEHPEGIDIVPWLNFTTFDIFGDLGFGESFNCLQHSEYHPWIALLFNSVKAASFIIAARFYPLIDFLLMKAIPQSLRDMQRAHFNQIVEKVERRINWEVERPDLMSHVLNHRKDGWGMSRGEININFMILTTVGSETTATCLSGTINSLLSNPDVLAKLAAEIRSRSEDGNFTFESLEGFQYLNAVIDEGLRLSSLIPYMLPRAVPPGGETVCGVWLPAGTSVSLQTYTLFSDPNLFHRATDFCPERWLPSALDPKSPFVNDQRHAVMPFITADTSCLGKHLARAEMRTLLAKVLWNFDIEPVGALMRWENLRTFLLYEKQPVKLRLRPRCS